MSGAMNGSTARRNLRISDLTALVVGFGLAALLIRAFGARVAEPNNSVVGVLGFVYLWLGLAMSGPVVLVLDRRSAPKTHPPSRARKRIGSVPAAGPEQARAPGATRPPEQPTSPEAKSESRAQYTRAELAWLCIGSYWIGMTFLVVPTQLHDTPLALVAVLQIVAAVALWFMKPKQPSIPGDGTPWTHWAAVILLVTWPLAWAAMILLTKSLP
jgi:hypothetical protein